MTSHTTRHTTPARIRRHLGPLALLLVIAGLVVPASAVHPVTLSLTEVRTAKEVDFDDGVLWILVLGSDARPGETLVEARADAIQLVGLDLDSGRAVGIGIPRDYYIDLPGPDVGVNRINTVLQGGGGPQAAAAAVEQLLGITPAYVLVTGFDGFRDMIDAIGGVEVRSDVAFRSDDGGLVVREGVNRFDAEEALEYSRSRLHSPLGDFARSANQQGVMRGILDALVANEDDTGFLERGTLAALAGFESDLSPVEAYRLAQAVTQVRPGRITTCVVPGTEGVGEGGASVILPDFAAVRRIGADAARDVRLDEPC